MIGFAILYYFYKDEIRNEWDAFWKVPQKNESLPENLTTSKPIDLH